MAAITVLLGYLLIGGPSVWLSQEARSDVDEFAAKHLRALGPEKARLEIRNRAFSGVVKYRMVQGGSGGLMGSAQLLTAGVGFLASMTFDHRQYPGEKFSFDGKEVYVDHVTPGRRSTFGNFLLNNEEPIREGLFGGVLSMEWPFLHLDSKRRNLEFKGLKKVKDRELLELRYKFPRRWDLTASLYFDPRSFLHIGTVYRFIAGSGQPWREPGTAQSVPIFELEEWFGQFRSTAGCILPTQWTIHLIQNPLEYEWTVSYVQISCNTDVDPSLFKLY